MTPTIDETDETHEADEADEADEQHARVIGGARVGLVGTTLSRLSGYARILALGYALGASRLPDAYNLANTIPNILYDLVLGGVLAGTLVPVFVGAVGRTTTMGAGEAGDGSGAGEAGEAGEAGQTGAAGAGGAAPHREDWEAVSAVFTVAVVALAGVTVVFFLAVPGLIHLYLLSQHSAAAATEQRLAISLLYLFVPQLALYGLVSLMTALLNARRRFAAPVFAPVLNNTVVIVAVLSLSHVTRRVTVDGLLADHTARLVLGLGTTVGVAVMAAAMVPSLIASGARLRWRWQPRHHSVRTVMRLSGWTAGFVAANQVALLVVTALAAREGGGFTTYTYAYVFFQLPHGIIAVSVMSALEPELADRWAANDTPAYRRILGRGIRLSAAFVVPAALGYAVLARPVVRLLLQHGMFDAAAARHTADVLAVMALGLPAFSLYLLLMRAYQAMQDTRTMFFTYLIENGLNIGFAFVLYPLAGVVGLAAALSLAYAGGCIVALRDMRRRLGGRFDDRLGVMGFRIVVAGIVSADAAVAVAVVLAHILGTANEAILVVRVGVSVVAGVTVYVRVARYFGVDEVRSLLRLRRRLA